MTAREDETHAPSQHALASIAAQLPGMLFQYCLKPNGDSSFPYASPGIEQLFGVSAELVARDASLILARIHPDDLAGYSASIAASAKDLTPWNHDYRIRGLNGDIRWVRTEATPARQEKGVLVWNGYSKDVTNERTQHEAMDQLRRRLGIATETSGIGIWDLDLITGELHWDDRMHRMYGTSPATFSGDWSAWHDRVHPEDQSAAVAGFENTIETSAPFAHDFRIVRLSDSAEIWIRARGTVLRHDDGTPYKVVGTNTDITDRKEAEERLQASESRFHGLYQTMSQGVVIQNRDGVIIDANPAAEIILGLSLAQMQGRVSADPRWRTVNENGDDYPGDQHPISRTLRDGKTVIDEIMGVYRPHDDSMRWVQVSSHARYRPGDETPYEAFAVFSDITEKRDREEALRDATEQAVRANRAKGDFLANMSHEIRTPMNGVVGTADLLLGTHLSDDQRQLTETLVDSAESLLTIINDILDFSRIESGQLAIEQVAFDPSVVLNAAISPLRSRVNTDAVTLTLVNPDQTWQYLGDPHRFRQVVTNLVGNAIKFTKSGSITAHLDCNPGGLQLSVSDTGIGIDAERQKELFQPFVQADTSTARRFGGTGLGLAISRRLVEAMGGTLTLTSALGEGSCFTVALPLAVHDLVPMKTNRLTKSEATEDKPALGLQILVAEDNRVNQLIISRLLDSLGAKSVVADNGLIAVEMMQQHPYDMILMDIQMPEMDGYEATRVIREREADHPFGETTPIVALTANAMSGDRERCLAAGMDDYLSKPVRRDDIVELFRRLSEQ